MPIYAEQNYRITIFSQSEAGLAKEEPRKAEDMSMSSKQQMPRAQWVR